MQFSDDIGYLCDVTTQHYLGLPSHSSEVEKRLEARRLKQRTEEKALEQSKN